MSELNISNKLKSYRRNLNLTLDEVAGLTGVSKAMLGQIERGQSSPTVNVLWKIANGLKLPFSSLLEEDKVHYKIGNINDEPVIYEEDGRMIVHTLFSFDPIKGNEIFYIEFKTGCNHQSDKHNDNVEETVIVIEGKLDMVLNDEVVKLEKGQAIRFKANIAHAYINSYDKDCTVHNIISYS